MWFLGVDAAKFFEGFFYDVTDHGLIVLILSPKGSRDRAFKFLKFKSLILAVTFGDGFWVGEEFEQDIHKKKVSPRSRKESSEGALNNAFVRKRKKLYGAESARLHHSRLERREYWRGCK